MTKQEAARVAVFYRIASALIFALAMLLAISVAVRADERADIIKMFERITPAVGALYAQEHGGDMKFLCTATAVDRYKEGTVILTANHCTAKGVSYLVNFGDGKMRPVSVWKAPHYEVNAQKHPRQYNEPETDMALFLMEGTDIPLVELADTSDLKPGAKLITVGYPLGVAKITYEGIVAGKFNRLGADKHGYLLLQIFGAPGSSGSAVVSVADGKIVAVLVAAQQAGVGLPVVFGTPITYRKHLIPILSEKE